MREARAGPMPGNVSSSSNVAVLILIGPAVAAGVMVKAGEALDVAFTRDGVGTFWVGTRIWSPSMSKAARLIAAWSASLADLQQIGRRLLPGCRVVRSKRRVGPLRQPRRPHREIEWGRVKAGLDHREVEGQSSIE